MQGLRDKLVKYIKKIYDVSPEYPWSRYASNAVFRHADNKKWFALVMDVEKEKLGLRGEGVVPVVNLKIDDLLFRDMIIQNKGIIPAYHMNKQHWITVLLDGSVSEKMVRELLEMSYSATSSSGKKEKLRGPKAWIIPANPKYYDVVKAFEESDKIDWKQGNGIKAGDTFFCM